MSLHVLCTRRLSSATDHKSLCHVPCSRSRTAIRSSFSSQGTTQPAIADGVGPLLLSPSATSETRALHFGKPLSQTQSKAISAFVSQQLRHTLLNTSRIDTLGNAHACAEPGSGAISSQPLTKTTRCVSSRTETTSPRVTHHVTSFPGVCPQPRTSAPQQPPLPPPLALPAVRAHARPSGSCPGHALHALRWLQHVRARSQRRRCRVQRRQCGLALLAHLRLQTAQHDLHGKRANAV